MIEARDIVAGPLRGAGFSVADGETLALVGPNGAGKSTLLRLLNGLDTMASGSIVVDGVRADGSRDARRALRRLVGLVRQDPRCQLVSGRVLDEAMFGPRNLGFTVALARERAQHALGQVGLADMGARAAETLSGGELQRLAVAGVLAMEPAWLAVDEPCAMLDEAARATVRRALGQGRGAAGVVWATHYVREVAAADSVLVLARGGRQVSPEELFGDSALLADSSLDGSLAAEAASFLVGKDAGLGTLAEPRDAVRALKASGFRFEAPELHGGPIADDALVLQGATVRAGRAKLLDDVCLSVPRGAVTVLAGRSGSGKTTAARALAGLLRLDGGRALLDGRPVRAGDVGLCLQRASDQLFCDTVLEDVAFGPRQLGMARDTAMTAAREALGSVGLSPDLWGLSPFALSGGEARKAAMAGVVACRPRAYVLDEPTAGLDGPSREEVRRLVDTLAQEGAAVLVVSHDLDEWLAVADSVALVDHGRLVWSGAPRDVLAPGVVERAGMRPSLGLLMLREATGWSQ